MKDGKYWYDIETGKLIEIDESTTGSDGKPAPPMDCILVGVIVVDDFSS